MGSTPTWARSVHGQKVASWTSIPSDLSWPGRLALHGKMVAMRGTQLLTNSIWKVVQPGMLALFWTQLEPKGQGFDYTILPPSFEVRRKVRVLSSGYWWTSLRLPRTQVMYLPIRDNPVSPPRRIVGHFEKLQTPALQVVRWTTCTNSMPHWTNW